MTNLNIPDELGFELEDKHIRFEINGFTTNWMKCDDSFVGRVDCDNLNNLFLTDHLEKEIEIKNMLDEGIRYFELGKYSKAIENFDEVLFYDCLYGEALLYKSYSLEGQNHFVKALRYYKRAISADGNLSDMGYHKNIIKKANAERDNFPKLKQNIYAGDEYFAKGDFGKAVESYNRALKNPSKFKNQILSKLLNKKATALLKINKFNEALDCFKMSLDVGIDDYALWGEGYCEYMLGQEINDRFKSRLDVSKKQMLRQISILNDLGYFKQSLQISEYLCQNHFKIDEFYLNLINARKFAMNGLGMDISEIDEILDILYK